jgi:hypothetical protein
MKHKHQRSTASDALRPEYDFDYSKGVRGKYQQRLIEEGTNIVVLDPELAKSFRDSAAVNDALRSLLELTRTTRRLTGRQNRPKRGDVAASSRGRARSALSRRA